MKNKILIKALKKVIALTDREMNELPDDAWNLLAEYYFHGQLLDEFAGCSEVSDKYKPFIADLQQQFGTSFPDELCSKISDYHQKRMEQIKAEFRKKFQINEILETIIYGKYPEGKFKKWFTSLKIIPGRNPLTKYID